jgi:superfamily I DNA/RNA helicase
MGVSDVFEQQLTSKQQEAVEYVGSQMLIKGIAGSGKTTVLLRKARKLVQESESDTVALFTFNSTLAHYARAFASIIDPDRVEVFTFHAWAGKQLRKMKLMLWAIDEEKREEVLKRAIEIVSKDHTHRFFHQESFYDFLSDEVSWIKGKRLLKREDYMSIERTGRGTKVRVTEADRGNIYDFYEKYQELLNKARQMDFDDYGLRLFENIDACPDSDRFDHVFIDEAQDLQQVQLEVLRMVAKKSLVVAADKGQKIYKTSFTWRDIGINVHGGRSKVLQNTFRSTKQIITLAHSLQKNDPIYMNRDEDYVDPIYPDVNGPLPTIVRCKDEYAEDLALVSLVQKLQESSNDSTIGVLCRSWRSVFRLRRRLALAGVHGQVIKKEEGDVNSPGPKLTTFHSAKGLEFDSVLITGINDTFMSDDEPDDDLVAVERRLLYVSMTRAKHELYLLYSGKTPRFIEELDSTLFRMELL